MVILLALHGYHTWVSFFKSHYTATQYLTRFNNYCQHWPGSLQGVLGKHTLLLFNTGGLD